MTKQDLRAILRSLPAPVKHQHQEATRLLEATAAGDPGRVIVLGPRTERALAMLLEAEQALVVKARSW